MTSIIQLPQVGTGVTEHFHSDRIPYTVIEIINPTTLLIQRDHYERTDKNGMSDSQTYTYTPNPLGNTIIITQRRNGQWLAKGASARNAGTRYSVGERSAHHDYSF